MTRSLKRIASLMMLVFVVSSFAMTQSRGIERPKLSGSTNRTSGKKVQGNGPTVVVPTVTGVGAVGRLTKWTAFTPIISTIADSEISEDQSGRIGIGTTSPSSKLTVQGMIESKTGGYRFPDGSLQTTAGVSSVSHDGTLTGNGTSLSPLAIASGGVGTNQLANNSITATKIATAQVVKSLNGLRDNVTLQAGSNITITPVGNTLTIASSGGSSPATTPFQGQIVGSWGNGDGIANAALTIPAGKRLVVEFITVTVSLVLGQSVVDSFLNSTLDGNFIQHRFAVNSNPTFPVSPFTHVVDKPVRIYADTLSVSIARTPVSGGASFITTVSGYLVDMP